MEEGTISKYLNIRRQKMNSAFKETNKGTNVLPHNANAPNLARFQETLNKLKEHSDMNVGHANGDVLVHYNQVLQTMGVSIGTPQYDILSRMIGTTFSNSKPFPGTIGSTLYGCHMPFKNADAVDAGCTPTCAGGVKVNNDSPTCGKQLFLSEPNGKDGFNINRIFIPNIQATENSTAKDAYIFIPRSKDRQFHQPNYDLKTLEYLQKNKVENIKFIGYDAANSVLYSVNDDFIPLQSLMPKIKQKQSKLKVQVPKGEGWDVKTVIIIFLFLLICAGLYYFNRGQ